MSNLPLFQPDEHIVYAAMGPTNERFSVAEGLLGVTEESIALRRGHPFAEAFERLNEEEELQLRRIYTRYHHIFAQRYRNPARVRSRIGGGRSLFLVFIVFCVCCGRFWERRIF